MMIVVKDFYAEWCMPCRMMAPVIEELKKKMKKVKFEKVNIEASQDEASRYGVRGVPTIIIEKDGVEVKRLIGLRTKEALEEAIMSV